MLTGWVSALLFNKSGTPYIFEILRISQHSISVKLTITIYDNLLEFTLSGKLERVFKNLLVLMLLKKLKVVIFLDNRISFRLAIPTNIRASLPTNFIIDFIFLIFFTLTFNV